MTTPTRDPEAHDHELLMMKAVDGELEPGEAERLEAWLELHPERRAELDDHHQIKEATDMLTQRILADARIEPPRADRATVGVATVLLVTAMVIATGFGLYHVLLDPGVDLIVKIAVGLAASGTLILFFHALRGRLRGLRHDPYEEIDL